MIGPPAWCWSKRSTTLVSVMTSCTMGAAGGGGGGAGVWMMTGAGVGGAGMVMTS